MAPMTTRLADKTGFVTDAQVAYYAARARGGVGTVTVEMGSPHPSGRHRKGEIGVWRDQYTPGLQRLARAIHSEGALASVQLGHAGSRTRPDVTGVPPLAPSVRRHDVLEGSVEAVQAVAMTKGQIVETVAAFAEAARRVQLAGFDVVEIHAAHGYLLSQFLTREENQRTDEFGGSLQRRAVVTLMVLEEILARAPGLAVVLRLSGNDFFEDGLRPEEAVQVARWAEKAGVHAVHVSGGHYMSHQGPEVMTPPMSFPEAIFLPLARTVRQQLSIPVVAVGKLHDPVVAEKAVAGGSCDLVALGRALLADPAWANKVRRGRAPRRCLGCNFCVSTMRSGRPLGCLVNPLAGNEQLMQPTLETQSRRKKVAVVGAGPAGLTYADMAAEHSDVTVFEREKRLGGSLRLAAEAPVFEDVATDKAAFAAYVDSMRRSCEEQGVEFRLNVVPVAWELAEFDEIVVATGAIYRWGLGPLIARLVTARHMAVRRLLTRVLQRTRIRSWFYHDLRKSTADRYATDARLRSRVVVVGDARTPGKMSEAIRDAARVFAASSRDR